jgi:glutamine synthetase
LLPPVRSNVTFRISASRRQPAQLRSAISTKDREFLKAGGVFDDDFIEMYIELKMQEIIRFEHTPHPVEFEMYYSA